MGIIVELTVSVICFMTAMLKCDGACFFVIEHVVKMLNYVDFQLVNSTVSRISKHMYFIAREENHQTHLVDYQQTFNLLDPTLCL